MYIGLLNAFRTNFDEDYQVTVEYPRKEKWDVPDGSRMRLYNNIDDCIACYKCSRICPTDCIDIESVKTPDSVDLGKTSTGNPKQFWIPKFDIDMVKCCYCDLCTVVCPTDCLVMTKNFEGSEYERSNLVYSFSNLDSEDMAEINEIMKEDKEEEKEQKSSSSTDEESKSSSSSSGSSAADKIKQRLGDDSDQSSTDQADTDSGEKSAADRIKDRLGDN